MLKRIGTADVQRSFPILHIAIISLSVAQLLNSL